MQLVRNKVIVSLHRNYLVHFLEAHHLTVHLVRSRIITYQSAPLVLTHHGQSKLENLLAESLRQGTPRSASDETSIMSSNTDLLDAAVSAMSTTQENDRTTLSESAAASNTARTLIASSKASDRSSATASQWVSISTSERYIPTKLTIPYHRPYSTGAPPPPGRGGIFSPLDMETQKIIRQEKYYRSVAAHYAKIYSPVFAFGLCVVMVTIISLFLWCYHGCNIDDALTKPFKRRSRRSKRRSRKGSEETETAESEPLEKIVETVEVKA